MSQQAVGFSYQELKDHLEIDQSKLTDALVKQPTLYVEVCEQTADAYRALAELKDNLETIKADLYVLIQQAPVPTRINSKGQEVEGKPPTVDETNSRIERTDEVVALKQQLREAELTYTKLVGLKRSYEMRNDSAKSLTSLINSGFAQA